MRSQVRSVKTESGDPIGRLAKSRLADCKVGQPLGWLCEPAVEADKGSAAFSLCQMKSVREIHSFGHPLQRRRGEDRVLERDPRQPRKGTKGFSDLGGTIAIGAAQDPVRFQ